jgi:hypothetical protein
VFCEYARTGSLRGARADPDVAIHTESELPDVAAQRIVLKLEALGLIR